jgi:hypothetical protein
LIVDGFCLQDFKEAARLSEAKALAAAAQAAAEEAHSLAGRLSAVAAQQAGQQAELEELQSMKQVSLICCYVWCNCGCCWCVLLSLCCSISISNREAHSLSGRLSAEAAQQAGQQAELEELQSMKQVSVTRCYISVFTVALVVIRLQRIVRQQQQQPVEEAHTLAGQLSVASQWQGGPPGNPETKRQWQRSRWGRKQNWKSFIP